MKKLLMITLAGLFAATLCAQEANTPPPAPRGEHGRHMGPPSGPQNLAIVLDCSSGAGQRFEFARRMAIGSIRRLKETDFVSVIVYDNRATVLVPSQAATDKEAIIKKIEALKPKGEAALFAGVSAGANEVRKNKDKGLANRVVVFGGGIGNVGPSSAEQIKTLSDSLKKEDIQVHLGGRPFGPGMGPGGMGRGPNGDRPGMGRGPHGDRPGMGRGPHGDRPGMGRGPRGDRQGMGRGPRGDRQGRKGGADKPKLD